VATHCKNRLTLFGFATFIGGVFATVIFRFRSDQLSHFGLTTLILGYVLLVLVFYLTFYMLNRLFIRLFDSSELNRLQKNILKTLVEAAIRGDVIEAGPSDLTEEAAWIATKKYWRPK
jgi:hypothetical protein